MIIQKYHTLLNLMFVVTWENMQQLIYSNITLNKMITLVQTDMLLKLKGTILIALGTVCVYQDSLANQDMWST